MTHQVLSIDTIAQDPEIDDEIRANAEEAERWRIQLPHGEARKAVG